MIDWAHVVETIGGNIFVAGVAYGAIKADLRSMRQRITQIEEDFRDFVFHKPRR